MVVAVAAALGFIGAVTAQATHRDAPPPGGVGLEIDIDRPLVTLGDEIEVSAKYKDKLEGELGEEGEDRGDAPPPGEGRPGDEPPEQALVPRDEPPEQAPVPGSSVASGVSFTIDYGDGSAAETLAPEELKADEEEVEAEVSGRHAYAAAGTYTVSVTAVPDAGEAQTATADVTVTTEPVAYPRPGRFACPEGLVPGAGFRDVARTSPHDLAVDCLVAKGVVNGTAPGTFAPAQSLTRGQMASLLVRSIELSGATLSAGGDIFDDDDGSVHEASIDKLALAGLVNGVAEGTFAAEAPLSRGQMASLLVRAYAFQAGPLPVAEVDYFADDRASVHQANINRAAAAGFAGGTGVGIFAPEREVTREQISTFLVRMLDLLTEKGIIS